jgi:hypothetical protein
MSLLLELPAELEAELSVAAAQLGLSVPEYIVRLLSRLVAATDCGKGPELHTGAELVAYWRNEGLLGTRQDIADAATHARQLREQAQARERS